MSAPPLTRRSLLLAAGGALAGAVVRPEGALALLVAPPGPEVWKRELGSLRDSGAAVRLGRRADLVGVEWRGPAEAALWLRFREPGGGWSPWASAGARGHGPDAQPSSATQIGDPVWTGGATEVQLRATRPLGGVALHLVDVSSGAGARRRATGPLASAAGLAPAAPVLAAGPGQPPIVARRAWAQGMARPRVAPGYGSVRMAFVHHTENPNGYAAGEVPAMLRAIYAFHRFVRGWNDIGYNFVVDLYGRIFEGRAGGIDEPVVGAHAGGYNLASTGVAVLGSFSGTPISPAAREALQRLLAWKLALHGRPAMGRVTVRVNPAGSVYSRFPANSPVSLARISGHRDGDSTSCPGDALYGELPGIRRAVRGLAGRPVRATLALAAATPGSAGSPTGGPAPGAAALPGAQMRTLTGTLTLLDGTPVAGAAIAVQARSVSARGEAVSERTIAQATTDASGAWSLPVTVLPRPKRRRGTSLRVLSTGAGGSGACVSDPLRIAGTVSLSAPRAPAPTPPAAAPPAP
jgi:hypothetical protein